MRAGLMQDLMALERRVQDLSTVTKDGSIPPELQPIVGPITGTLRQMWQILYDIAHDIDDAASVARRADRSARTPVR